MATQNAKVNNMLNGPVGQVFIPGNLIVRQLPPDHKPGKPINFKEWVKQPIRSEILKKMQKGT